MSRKFHVIRYYMPLLDYLSRTTHCLTWGPRHTECARHVPLTPKRRHWTDLSSIDTGIPLIHSSDVKSSLSATCSTSEGCVPYYRKPSWTSRLYKNPTKITSLEWPDIDGQLHQAEIANNCHTDWLIYACTARDVFVASLCGFREIRHAFPRIVWW